jgi:hypothetical protein
MDHKEMGIHTINWVDLNQDMDYWRALVNAALKLQVPNGVGSKGHGVSYYNLST